MLTDGVRHLLLHKLLYCRECHHHFWAFRCSPLKPLLLLALVGALIGIIAWFSLDSHLSISVAKAPDSLPHARAEAGDAEAQLQLGMRYVEGNGVIQNDKARAHLRFNLAAAPPTAASGAAEPALSAPR